MASGTVFRVFRHADPEGPEVFGYQHVDGDPACAGAPAGDVHRERAA